MKLTQSMAYGYVWEVRLDGPCKAAALVLVVPKPCSACPRRLASEGAKDRAALWRSCCGGSSSKPCPIYCMRSNAQATAAGQAPTLAACRCAPVRHSHQHQQ